MPLPELELLRSRRIDREPHQVCDRRDFSLRFGMVPKREEVVVLRSSVHHGVPHVGLEAAASELLVDVEHARLAEIDVVGALGHQLDDLVEVGEQHITGNVLTPRLVPQQLARDLRAEQQLDRSRDGAVSATQPDLDGLLVLHALQEGVGLHAALVDSEALGNERVLQQVAQLHGERDCPRACRVTTPHAVGHRLAVDAAPVREFTRDQADSERADGISQYLCMVGHAYHLQGVVGLSMCSHTGNHYIWCYHFLLVKCCFSVFRGVYFEQERASKHQHHALMKKKSNKKSGNQIMIDLETPTTQMQKQAERDVLSPTTAKDIYTDQIVERHLTLVTPELAHQTDIEVGIIENWLAFQVRPHIVNQIYKTGDMDVNLNQMRDDVIVPGYRRQQQECLEESASIIGITIPQLESRLTNANINVENAQSVVDDAEEQLSKEHHNPRFDTGIKDWRRALKNRKKEADDLKQDIANTRFRAQIKDTTFAYIHRFVTTASEEEMHEKVSDITFVAKKDALREVIWQLESEARFMKAENETHEEKLDLTPLETRLAAARAELKAMEASEAYNKGRAETPVEETAREEKEPAKVSPRPQASVRRTGSTAVVTAFRAAFFK